MRQSKQVSRPRLTLRPEREFNETAPPVLDEKKNYPVYGRNLISQLYAAVNIVGNVGSGKTRLVWNILKGCCGPESSVFIFSTTAHNDKSWDGIKAWLEDSDIRFSISTTLDEDGSKCIDMITERQVRQSIIDKKKLEIFNLQKLGHYRDPSLPFCGAMFKDPDYEFRRPPKERDFLPTIDPFLLSVNGVMEEYAPIIIILDDMSKDQLNDSSVQNLIKRYRHFKCKVILSSQYAVDTSPTIRENTACWFVFGGLPNRKLQIIYDAIGSSIDLDEFVARYREATAERHSYLRIDRFAREMSKKTNLFFDNF